MHKVQFELKVAPRSGCPKKIDDVQLQELMNENNTQWNQSILKVATSSNRPCNDDYESRVRSRKLVNGFLINSLTAILYNASMHVSHWLHVTIVTKTSLWILERTLYPIQHFHLTWHTQINNSSYPSYSLINPST